MTQMNTVNNILKLTYIVDAFVALGGMATKEGFVSKSTLIEIIKTEFELTIDMEVIILVSLNIV
jgi:hypothetical protein